MKVLTVIGTTPLQVPPEMHREMFLQAKKHAESYGMPAMQDMFKSGFDFKGAASSIFGAKS